MNNSIEIIITITLFGTFSYLFKITVKTTSCKLQAYRFIDNVSLSKSWPCHSTIRVNCTRNRAG